MRTRLVIPAVLAALLAAGAAQARPTPAIQRERAREKAVVQRIDTIGRNLEQTIQDYDGAKLRLARVEHNLALNELALGVARANLHTAQQRLAERLVSLYEGGRPSTLDVLTGATSLSQILDRIESAHVLTRQDSALAGETLRFRGNVQRREALLRRQKRERAATVARLAERKRTIEAALAEQNRLLRSIHQTLGQLLEQEAERQRRLAALAQARIRRAIAARQEQAELAAEQTPVTDPATGLVESPAPAIAATTSGAGHPEAAQIAARYLGIPYVWGGASTGGFDCSGLVMYVYAQLGIALPHYTVSQWNATIPISSSDMQPGDLVFFDGLGHVGIYIGGGEFIDAPHTGSVVRVDSLGSFGGFDGARRVP